MIYRGRIKNIVFEFSLPVGDYKGVIVICDGLPSVPKRKEMMVFLSGKGFLTVYPRYQGTWESGGEFLNESPVKDIEEIIKLIEKGFVVELYANKEFKIENKKIFLVGSSFGGAVALAASGCRIFKIVALSPIVDFKDYNSSGNEQDLMWLEKFIKRAFGFGYRFKDENWERMARGLLFNPPQIIEKEKAKNILVVYDKLDSAIDYRKIKAYADRNNTESMATENIGHLSFSKIPEEIWKNVLEWMEE